MGKINMAEFRLRFNSSASVSSYSTDFFLLKY